jgi:hypothetical protein
MYEMGAHRTPKVKVYRSCLSCFHTFQMSWETDTKSSTYVTTSLGLESSRKICAAKKCQDSLIGSIQYYTTKSDTTYSLNCFLYHWYLL